MTSSTTSRILLLATTQALLAATGCVNLSHPTADLDPDALRWVASRNAVGGYTLAHPDLMAARREDGTTLLRMARPEREGALLRALSVPVLVRFTTEERGRRNGAWFGRPPAGATTLAGRPAELYDYTHWDGPFGIRTLAYVIPWRDRWLGLEFRTPGELSPVQQRILDTFTLDGPGENDGRS